MCVQSYLQLIRGVVFKRADVVSSGITTLLQPYVSRKYFKWNVISSAKTLHYSKGDQVFLNLDFLVHMLKIIEIQQMYILSLFLMHNTRWAGPRLKHPSCQIRLSLFVVW